MLSKFLAPLALLLVMAGAQAQASSTDRTKGYVVMMTLVGGGLVSFWGPVIGTIVFFLARDVIGALTTSWMLWFGLLFVTLVLFKPEGIAGMLSAFGKRERRIAPAAAPQPQPR